MKEQRSKRQVLGAALALCLALGATAVLADGTAPALVQEVPALTEITHWEHTAEDCYAEAKDSVLYIRSYYASGTLKSTGSGFVATPEGLAVTAAHVIDQGARVTALLPDGTELEAAVVISDTDTDVAVLRLPAGQYPALTVAEQAPDGGAVLRAMGYPSKDTLMITEGIVSAPRGTVSEKERMLVTCALVNGMSGGPIFNKYGEVAGVASGSVRTMAGVHLSALHGALTAALDAANDSVKEAA